MINIKPIGALAAGVLFVIAGGNYAGKTINKTARPLLPATDFVAPPITKAPIVDRFIKEGGELLKKVK